MRPTRIPTGEIDKTALYPTLRFRKDERLIEEVPFGYWSRENRIRDLHNLIRILQLQVENVEGSLDRNIAESDDSIARLEEQSAWITKTLARSFPKLREMIEVARAIIYETPQYANLEAAASDLRTKLEPLLQQEPRFAATVLDLAYQTREEGNEFALTTCALYEFAREYAGEDIATALGAEIGLIELCTTEKIAKQEPPIKIITDIKKVVLLDPTLTRGAYKREVLRDAIRAAISTTENNPFALFIRASYQLRQNKEVKDEETYFSRALELDAALIDPMIDLSNHYAAIPSEKPNAVFRAVINATKRARPELSQRVYNAVIATAKELRDKKRYRECANLCETVLSEQPENPHATYFAATALESFWRDEGHHKDNSVRILQRALQLYESGKGSSAQLGAERVRELLEGLLK